MNKKIKAFLAITLSLVLVASATFVAVPVKSETKTAAIDKKSQGSTPASVSVKNQSQNGAVKTAESIEEAADLFEFQKSKDPVLGDCDGGDCDYNPVIVLPGINHSPTYLYDKNDNPVLDKNSNQLGGTLFIFDQDDLLKTVIAKLAVPLLKMLIFQKDCGFTDKVYEVAKRAFYVQENTKEGVPVNNLQVRRFGSIADMTPDDRDWAYRMVPMQPFTHKVGEDHVYFFTFNLVGNPMDAVDELHEYIQDVKSKSGHSKVSFLNVSLGGTIFTAYIDKYGWEDLDSVISVVGAMDGTDIIADFFERSFRLDDEFVYTKFLPTVMKSESNNEALGYLLNAIIRIMPKDVFQGTLTKAIDGVLDTFMLNCPQFWACIPCDRYDELAARYLSGPEHAVLKAKTDEYHQAQLNFAKNVRDAVAGGVKINNISGSNLAFGDQMYSFFSIMGSTSNKNSDGIIQLGSTTMGATGAAPGKTLPANYTPQHSNCTNPDHNHIAPDRTIDASTSILPENTWIFLGQHHEAGEDAAILNLATALLTDPELVDVNSNPAKWPQFNGTMNTNDLRKMKYYNGQYWGISEKFDVSTISADDLTEFKAAIAQAEIVLKSYIADSAMAEAAKTRLNNILIKIGAKDTPAEPDKYAELKLGLAKFLSNILFEYYGPNGFSDGGYFRQKLTELFPILSK